MTNTTTATRRERLLQGHTPEEWRKVLGPEILDDADDYNREHPGTAADDEGLLYGIEFHSIDWTLSYDEILAGNRAGPSPTYFVAVMAIKVFGKDRSELESVLDYVYDRAIDQLCDASDNHTCTIGKARALTEEEVSEANQAWLSDNNLDVEPDKTRTLVFDAPYDTFDEDRMRVLGDTSFCVVEYTKDGPAGGNPMITLKGSATDIIEYYRQYYKLPRVWHEWPMEHQEDIERIED